MSGPASGRVSAAGRRLYISPAGAGRRPRYMLYCTGLLVPCYEKRPRRQNCHLTRKIGDPLYTTFQKIFTIIRIFLKSEAPKAPGLFTFVHRGGLDYASPSLLSLLSPLSLPPLLVSLSMLRSSSGTPVASGSGVVQCLGGPPRGGEVTAEEAFLCIYADS